MINDTIECEVTPELLAERAREYGIEEPISQECLAAMVVFLSLSEDDREMFLRSLPANVCAECGKASCLCGYPC